MKPAAAMCSRPSALPASPARQDLSAWRRHPRLLMGIYKWIVRKKIACKNTRYLPGAAFVKMNVIVEDRCVFF